MLSKGVGFVGLGNMGFHMAKNVLKAGVNVVAFDVNKDALEKFKQAGGNVAQSPAEMADQVGTVVTMLPSNDHVKDVYMGSEGILQTLKEDSLCIDSSTIDPSVSRLVYEKVKEKKSYFADGPVSGGVGGAEAGSLTFMVGADDEIFVKCLPVLENMGKNIVHCGDVGTGQVAKLCNNMVLGVSMLGVSEAMNVGTKLGMDRKTLAGILNTSTARCWSSDTYNPAPGVMEGVPSSRDYEGGFGSALMLKDLGLVSDAAKSVGAPIPMGESAHALYQLMVSNGLGKKDFSVAYKFYGGSEKDEDGKKLK